MAAYLVIVAGLRGPSPQIWYDHDDDGQFIVPRIVPIEKYKLPEMPWSDEPWSIREAVAAARI